MPLLIDGHNVIGSGVFDDIKLSHEDDEARFVARVRAWKSRYWGQIEIIFDRGITEGRSPELSGSGIETRFARNPTDADDLIRRRIRKRTHGLILVTNDAVLRQEAERHGVEVWRADELIDRLANPPAPRRRVAGSPADSDANLPAQEVDAWMRIFEREKRPEESNPIWTPPFKRPKRPRPKRTSLTAGSQQDDAQKPMKTKKTKKNDGRRKR